MRSVRWFLPCGRFQRDGFQDRCSTCIQSCLSASRPHNFGAYGRYDITVGEAYAGAVMGDISTRRGRIVGTDSNDEGETIIVVRVPYAEVLSYTKDLRALSRGSGTYSVRLNGYEPAPYDVQKKLVELYEASRK